MGYGLSVFLRPPRCACRAHYHNYMNKFKNFFQDKVSLLLLLVFIVCLVSLVSPLMRKYSPVVYLVLFLLAFIYSLNVLRKQWKNLGNLKISLEERKNLIYPAKDPEMIVRVKCNNCNYEGEASEFAVKNKVGFKFTGLFLTTQICPQCQATRNLTLILNNNKKIEIPDYPDAMASYKRYGEIIIFLLILFALAFLYMLFRNNWQIK